MLGKGGEGRHRVLKRALAASGRNHDDHNRPRKSDTFRPEHLSAVRAEEMLRMPGLVHCRQHFLEKEHTETSEGCSSITHEPRQEKEDDSRPGWEQRSKHSAGRKGGGSPWGSRPSHCARRRGCSQSPLCSERRRSAPGATLAPERGSPGEEMKLGHRETAAGCPRAYRLHSSEQHLSHGISCKRRPPGVTQHGGLDPGPTYGVCCPCIMESQRGVQFPDQSC